MKIWPLFDHDVTPKGKGLIHPKICQNIFWPEETLKLLMSQFHQNGTWALFPQGFFSSFFSLFTFFLYVYLTLTLTLTLKPWIQRARNVSFEMKWQHYSYQVIVFNLIILYNTVVYLQYCTSNYRLITVYLLLRVNLEKIMHAC